LAIFQGPKTGQRIRPKNGVFGHPISSHPRRHLLQISVVKVTEESFYFAADECSSDGVPPRGTVIQMSDREYILYTEGREENQVWRKRIPTALRIAPQEPDLAPHRISVLLRQVHDLSQVNWRGFNAQSKPISTHYGKLIADILSHVPGGNAKALFEGKRRKALEERMWFV
jgi:hypothetical protein